MLNLGPAFYQIAEWIHNQTDMVLLVQVAAISLFTSVFIIAVICKRLKKGETLFVLFGALTIILFRMLTLYSDSYNPDEGMHLANSIALYYDFRPWGSTDFTTFGPVNAVLIVLLARILDILRIQGGLTYFSLRALNIILLTTSFIFFVKILNKSVNYAVSKAISVLFIVFYSFHFNFDVLAYNAEIAYIFFLTAALYLLYKLDERLKISSLFFYGLVCGIIPYIKLQTVPMCIILCAGGYYLLVRSAMKLGKEKIQKIIVDFLVLSLGILLPTIILVIKLLTFENGLSDAWFYYIENAKSHIGNPGITKYLSQFVKMLELFSDDALKICISVVILLLFLIIVLKLKLSEKFLFSGLFLMVSMFAVVRPFSLFYHYVNFLVIPVLLFLAETVQMLFDNEKHFGKINIKLLLLTVLFLCPIREFGMFYEEIKTSTVFSLRQVVGEANSELTELSKFIVKNTGPDDMIVVWGWESRVFVYSKRRSATRQTDIQRLYWPYDERNVEMYISDILENEPKYIVDVVAPNSCAYEDENIYALGNHAVVWNAIKDHYMLVETIPVSDGSYKIYELIHSKGV